MKKVYQILSIVVITAASCFPPAQGSQQQKEAKQTFTFDYTPKTSNKPGSSNMVLAFLKPTYAAQFQLSHNELFKNFQKGISSDVEELIIVKGFTLKGPYTAYDEMIYQDKKAVDMVITIEINPEFTSAEGHWTTHTSTYLGTISTTYTYAGKVSLVGKINISGVEPMSYQKIWSKSVSIPNIENIPITTSTSYSRMLSHTELLNTDPSVYNAIGAALQAQYEGIMNKMEAHFSAEELMSLKPQINELKGKKG